MNDDEHWAGICSFNVISYYGARNARRFPAWKVINHFIRKLIRMCSQIRATASRIFPFPKPCLEFDISSEIPKFHPAKTERIYFFPEIFSHFSCLPHPIEFIPHTKTFFVYHIYSESGFIKAAAKQISIHYRIFRRRQF